jgi:ribulose-5-phosphate 4-epimerase/fuculose-1-phosphate aldolase
MELLDEYVELCRLIGGWTDWVQGVGGNCSIKKDNSLIIKKSGARIGDTTKDNGWVICSITKLKEKIVNNEENAEDTIISGVGKPSIESFMHTIPARIVVHLHPSHMMSTLCSDHTLDMIPYVKPGIGLAKKVLDEFRIEKRVYLLQNHGIILCGDSINDILGLMKLHRGWTNIAIAQQLYYGILQMTSKPMIVKTYKGICTDQFKAFTPDILVFLQSKPLLSSESDFEHDLQAYIQKHTQIPSVVYVDNVLYIISHSISQAYDILEILNAYNEISTTCKELTHDEQISIVSWDKEIARKAGST